MNVTNLQTGKTNVITIVIRIIERMKFNHLTDTQLPDSVRVQFWLAWSTHTSLYVDPCNFDYKIISNN